jgi:hypothetical protein
MDKHNRSSTVCDAVNGSHENCLAMAYVTANFFVPFGSQ